MNQTSSALLLLQQLILQLLNVFLQPGVLYHQLLLLPDRGLNYCTHTHRYAHTHTSVRERGIGREKREREGEGDGKRGVSYGDDVGEGERG